MSNAGGDVLEATLEAGVIVLRPKAVVDRPAVAERVERLFAGAARSPEDAARSEDELMVDAVAEVAAVRAARRSSKR